MVTYGIGAAVRKTWNGIKTAVKAVESAVRKTWNGLKSFAKGLFSIFGKKKKHRW